MVAGQRHGLLNGELVQAGLDVGSAAALLLLGAFRREFQPERLPPSAC
jgi:hypothetical protein